MRRILGRLTDYSARQTLLLGVQIILGGTLFALLLVLAERHNHRFDLTPTKSFVLSDESVRVAAGLQTPLRITIFYNSQDHAARRDSEDLLQLFSDASPRITFQLLDLDRSPGMAKKYGISSFNTGVIEADGQIEELRGIDEEQITGAMLKLTRRAQRSLCFLTGHGEHSPQDASDRTGYSEVAKALEQDNFAIRTLETIPNTGVPPTCTVLIVPGPTRALLPGEADMLSRYVDGGGRLLVMVDPGAPQSIVQFLARYDVRAGEDIVVDERNRFYGADSFMPRVPIFDEGTFQKNLDTAAVFALARTVSPMASPESRIKVLLLALSSPDSWAHIGGDTVPEGKVVFDRDKDRPGPLPVGVMALVPLDRPDTTPVDEPGPPPKDGRLIVFGDSDFPSNLYLNLLGNKDLFMSTIGVLAEDQELVAMRHKGLPRSSLSPISLTAQQGRIIFWIAVIVEPAGFALLGILLTWRRRRRAAV